MNFGYLIVVAEHDEVDYTQLAYALALTIKNTQKPGYDQVAVVTDDPTRISKLNSSWVFDHVIEWNRETFWDGRSWMDQLSPFEYTVCLDADMLFMRDYSHWIDYFIKNSELLCLIIPTFLKRHEIPFNSHKIYKIVIQFFRNFVSLIFSPK
jgi:hypothetical protein